MGTGAHQPATRTPFFTAPPGVVWLSVAIIAAHGARLISPAAWVNEAFYWLALIPARLDLMLHHPGSAEAYSIFSLLLASVGHVLLHADWMHVLMNTGMLLALGAPVARRLGMAGFMAVFLISATAGALVFFVLRSPDSAAAIGASGGVSGILAGAFMLMNDPRAGWPVLISRGFLQTSAAFLLLNVVLAFSGPSLFGAGIAWDAHIGGYIAGALIMAAFSARR